MILFDRYTSFLMCCDLNNYEAPTSFSSLLAIVPLNVFLRLEIFNLKTL